MFAVFQFGQQPEHLIFSKRQRFPLRDVRALKIDADHL